MIGLLRKILRAGRSEATPPRPDNRLAAACRLNGWASFCHVDAGSCNGCEMGIAVAFGPQHDAERYGARLVASARRADALLVTGPVGRNMRVPLLRTYEAAPQPVMVIALGDCALDSGVAGVSGVSGAVSEVLPVDLGVPGCPPTPEAIFAALRTLTGR